MLANITHNIIFHHILVQYLPTECKRKWTDGSLWAGAVFHLSQDVVPNDPAGYKQSSTAVSMRCITVCGGSSGVKRPTHSMMLAKKKHHSEG